MPTNLMISEEIQSRVLLTLRAHPKLGMGKPQWAAMLRGSAQATCDMLARYAE